MLAAFDRNNRLQGACMSFGFDEAPACEKSVCYIENLAVNPPTEREMKIIKNNLLKSAANLFQSSTYVCDTIGTSLIDGDFNSIADYKNAINVNIFVNNY